MWVGVILGFVAGIAIRPAINALSWWRYCRQGDEVLLSAERRLSMMREERQSL